MADLKSFKEKFNDQYFTNIPSADTVEYACQELKLPNAIEISDSGVEHQINFNDKLNNTLAHLIRRFNYRIHLSLVEAGRLHLQWPRAG